jgi:conjugative relaxase-like TrwC/TraI family protein
VLSIFPIENAAAAASYFERDDYYFDSAQRAPSSWWGRGAERLGLEGLVDRTAFTNLLAGTLPDGTELPKRQGKIHQPGIDLTFSAPKSVSLLALVAKDERVLAAHEASVSEALGYLEKESAEARVTDGGLTRIVRTENLVVARFNHDTSRELDPQLHTHAVVMNTTEREGEWRALFRRDLLRNKMAAGAIYRARLAEQLQAIGYTIDRTHADGRFEVRGFSPEQLRGFSKRREAIEAAMEARGLEGAEGAEQAALRTRASKQEVDRNALHRKWRSEAKALAVDFPIPGPDQRPVEQDRLQAARAAVDFGLQHLGERAAVFAERDLMAQAMAAAVGQATLDHVRAAIGSQREEGRVMETPASPGLKDDLGARVTTPEALATERGLLMAVRRGENVLTPILDRATLDARLQARSETQPLTDGQREAITLAVTSPHRFVGVQGYAGTGKTTALRTVRELAEGEGVLVRGFAPSATAAQLLADDAGIKSQTLASFLLELERAPPPDRSQKSLWVVDEISMVGNANALQILEAAERHNAHVILLGDRDQLPSIEAGKAFALLADRELPLATMEQIVRQQDLTLLRAVRATVDHQPAEALELLAEDVVSISKRGDRMRAVANAFLDTPAEERRETLVLTNTNADRVELNQRIRYGLRSMADLTGPEVDAEVLRSRGLTAAEAREARSYAPGDVVRFGRAYKKLGVEAGERLRVRAIGDNNTVVLERGTETISLQPHLFARLELYESSERRLSAGDRIRWTRNDKAQDRRNGEQAEVLAVDPVARTAQVRVREEVQTLNLDAELHWDHAYVTTVHAAQGRTADRAILHLDTSEPQLIGHQSFYVALSRARHGVKIYTDHKDRLPGAVSRTLVQPSALEAMEQRPPIDPGARTVEAAAPAQPERRRGLERDIGFGFDGL